MALTRGKLTDIQTIPSTAGVIYANPVSTKTFIGAVTLHNTNTTSEFVQVFYVPDSNGNVGIATLTNRFIAVSLDPNATISFPLPGDGFPLTDTNDSIQAGSTTNNKVTIVLSGPKEV